MESDLGVNIDLYNLEDVKFEGSKYVLTSPRSLEACSRLNVKDEEATATPTNGNPIELLYKPLSEFQEELLPQDVRLRTIYSVYDESEQIRQRKLKLCREERSRIIGSENKGSSLLATKSRLSTLPSDDVKHRQSRSKKKTTFASGVRGGYKGRSLQRSIDRESSKLHKELLSKKDRNPPRPKSAPKTRPQSGDKRKTQRCSSSVTIGSKVKHRSGSAPNVRLPARDEKILQLMRDRRESEKQTITVRDETHRLWDDQKKREEALRIIAENKRRQLLAEENRIKNTRKERDQQMRAMDAEQDLERRKLAIHESDKKTEMSLMNQLRMQELQISDKIRKETAKKEIQEQNLKAQEKADEEMKQLLLCKQISDLQSAAEKKDVRIHQESLKKFLDNRQEREQFEQRQNLLKSQEKETEALLKSSIDIKLSQAESNLSQVLEQRSRQLEERQREEHEKLHRARKTHRKLEAEMEAWRYGLLQHKKLMEDKASEVVNRSTELKAWQAWKNRTQKEQEQRKNMSKIHRDDERWRRDLEKSLFERDRKVDDLLEEKERTVTQTRSMAQLSQTLRDDIKEKYMSDTFDKKVLEAQMYANLDRGYRSKSPALKNQNRSSIKIC